MPDPDQKRAPAADIEDWACVAMGCGETVEIGDRYSVVHTRWLRRDPPGETEFTARVAHWECWPKMPMYRRPDPDHA